jgi:hypothetical protein
VRIRHKVYPKISDDSAGKNLQFAPDDALAEVIIDVYTKQANSYFSVVAGATETMSLGDVAAVKGVYLEVNGDCDVYVNGGVVSIPMKLATGGTVAKLFLEATITSISVKAPALVAVTGKICVWGD